MDKQEQILEKLQKLDSIETFLQEHMVTKGEFGELQNEVKEVKKSVSNLAEAVERLATLVKKYTDEHETIKHQLLVVQDWIRKAADKIGVEFKL